MYVKVFLKCGDHFLTTADSLDDARKGYIGSKINHGSSIEECIRVELATEEEITAGICWYQGFTFSDKFWTPYEDYAYRIGQKFSVVRRATTQDDIDVECLPKWLIRFEDGETIFAHPEEIIAEEIIHSKKQMGLLKECPIVGPLDGYEAHRLMQYNYTLESNGYIYESSEENRLYYKKEGGDWDVSHMTFNDFLSAKWNIKTAAEKISICNSGFEFENKPDVAVCTVTKGGKVVNTYIGSVEDAIKHAENMREQYSKEDISQILVVKQDYQDKNEIMYEYSPEPICWYEKLSFAKTYTTLNSEYKDKIGEPFSVVRRANERDEIDSVSLPQWLIRFKDGKEIFAFPEEILECTDQERSEMMQR